MLLVFKVLLNFDFIVLHSCVVVTEKPAKQL